MARAGDPAGPRGAHVPAFDGCFGCRASESGLGLRQTGRRSFRFAASQAHQGAPGRTHGGVLAAAMDEAIGMYVWSHPGSYATARLEVDYLLPVPPGAELNISIASTARHKAKIYVSAEAKLADAVAVRAVALYIKIKADITPKPDMPETGPVERPRTGTTSGPAAP